PVNRIGKYVTASSLDHAEHVLHRRYDQQVHRLNVRRNEEVLVCIKVQILPLLPLHEPESTRPDGLGIWEVERILNAFPNMLGRHESQTQHCRYERRIRFL